MSIDRIMREEARLVILKALADEPSETLNSSLLGEVLATFGIYKPREWVHAELGWLAEMGAVTITEAGSVKIARLTETGHRHLRREVALPGVKRPSRPEA